VHPINTCVASLRELNHYLCKIEIKFHKKFHTSVLDKNQKLGRASAAHGVLANKQRKSSQKIVDLGNFKNENSKNMLSVFAKKSSIAPAAHGILANEQRDN